MTEHIDIHKAGAVLLDGNGNFLVTRAANKDIFVAPGGKLEIGETPLQALVRELMEEVQVEAKPDTAEHLGNFRAIAAGQESKIVEMETYLVHEWKGEPEPANEIAECKWINSQTKGVKLGSIFEHDVMPMLKKRGLID